MNCARTIVAAVGLITAALGLTVVIGWYTHDLALLRVQPGWTAMAFNTALGFLLCGLSLILLSCNQARFALIGGIYGVLVGSLTLAEYLFHFNAHIDQLFMRSFIPAGFTSPGRMALCSAINFTLIGLVYLMSPAGTANRWSIRATGTFGAIIAGLGVIALSGYSAGLTASATWSQFTRMSLYTATCFVLLGSGTIAYAWLLDRAIGQSRRLPDWTPAVVGVAGATIALCIWQILIVNQSTQIELIRNLQQSNASTEFTSLIGTQLLLTDGALVFGLGLSLLLAVVVYLAQTAQGHAIDVDQMNSALGSLNDDLSQQMKDRMQAEAALRDARDELESRVQQRTAELARANSDLEEAIDEKRLSAERQRTFVRDILSSVTEGRLSLCYSERELPQPIGDSAELTELSTEDIRSVRLFAGQAANSAGLPDERTYDLLTAVGEAAMNAVVHGGGGEAVVYCQHGDAVQVWISDRGNGIDIEHLHQATLRRGYTTAGSFGHGFWMMLKLVDKVWLLTGPTGTTVVLEQHRIVTDSFMDAALGMAA